MSTTEENKAKVRRMIEEVWNKGNLALVDELVAPNYIYHFPGREDIKGPEGLKQYVTMVRTVFPDLHITIDDMVAEGEKVACRYTCQGTHKGKGDLGIPPTDKQLTFTGIVISHAVDGKGVEVWESLDQLTMLQQMGVIPPMGQGGG
jgi:steroid delta-isomerase-like uncharacterized protein